MLPKDPYMMMSTINMWLRDGRYDTLEDLCADCGMTRENIESLLADAGFEYNDELKKFW